MRAPTFKQFLGYAGLTRAGHIHVFARFERLLARRAYLHAQEGLRRQHFAEREERRKVKAERNHAKVTRMHARWHMDRAIRDPHYVARVSGPVSREFGLMCERVFAPGQAAAEERP